MGRLVQSNQSAFIRGRLIHENFKDVQLTAKVLHQKKKPAALLKIDISKAFDTVNWRFLIDLLQHMGFSRRWQNWISLILLTDSTKIIVNGSLGRRISHARGLRQGDPLSPLLFVLAMEVLNSLLKRADALGLLLPLDDRVKDRVFLYADDVVLFIRPHQQDLIVVKAILEIFARASGLKTNLDKCHISPIQCNLEDTVSLLRHFPGRLDPFPTKYLGVPLSLKKLSKKDLQPLVDKMNDRLPSWKSRLLSKAGRAVLIKSVLSAIPMHTAMVVDLSPWAIKQIDKRRRAFLWKGSDDAKGGSCMLAWPKVCQPLELGGLGFLDLKLFGYALRMRWLWMKRTEDNRPWSQLPDKHEDMVLSMFQASISIELGDGNRSFF